MLKRSFPLLLAAVLFAGCSSIPSSTPTDPIDSPGVSTLENCTDQKCRITKAIEEQIAWTSYDGKDFCDYMKFDETNTESPFYLYVDCAEYYIKTKELTCGDGKDNLSKKEDCENYVNISLNKPQDIGKCDPSCEIKDLPKPELTTGGGITGPVKVTIKEDGKIETWQPEENKDYMSSLKAHFPEKYLKEFDKMTDTTTFDDLSNNIQTRAEKYFDMKVSQ